MSKKEDIFLPTPFPSHPLTKTAGTGPFGAVLPSSTCGAMSLEHFKNKKERGEAEKDKGGSVYKNIVTKKENWWLWNIKKMCGSFLSFPFFVWCYYHCLFLRINISTVAFCFNVPFLRLLFLFLYCYLFDLLWLFTPFQMSIGKKQNYESAVLSQLVIPDPDSCPSLFCPKCSRQEIWK